MGTLLMYCTNCIRECSLESVVATQEVTCLPGQLLILFQKLLILRAVVALIQTQVNMFRSENSANTLRTAMHLNV